MAATNDFAPRDEMAGRTAEFELRIVDHLAGLERRMDDQFRAQTRLIMTLLLFVLGCTPPSPWPRS
jgi:hypothetical protein